MLAELKSAEPDLNIEIMGVNMASDTAFNNLVTDQRLLPWLQDNEQEDAWNRWGVIWRDVRILDGRNQLVAVYNLTEHDLTDPENRATLKQLFLAAAKAGDSDKDGLPDDWELRYFGNLSQGPLDDLDKDGSNNLTEFALGTNPADAKSNANTSVRPLVVKEPLQRALFGVGFHRAAGGLLKYVIESSSDLVHWNSSEMVPSQPLRVLFDGTGTAEATYVLSRPMEDQKSGFVRIRALPRP